MYCPDGYISLHEVRLAFVPYADDWWEQFGKALQRAEGLAPTPWTDEEGLDDFTPIIAYRKWAMYRFIERQNEHFLAASPAGQVMRLADFAYQYVQPFEGPFPKTLDAQRALVTQAEQGFTHIDDYYFIVRPCGDEAKVAREQLQTEIDILEKFRDWSICWKPANLSTWKDDLGALADLRNVAVRKAGQGRPGKQSIALKFYDQLFPQGHVGSTMKEVLKTILEAGGPALGEDTLRRALKSR